MIISCPACQTSYRIDAGSLGAKGRSVRCASCGNRWFVAPAAADAPPSAAPPSPSRPEPASAPLAAGRSGEGAAPRKRRDDDDDMAAGEAARGTPLAKPPPAVPREPRRPSRAGDLAGWLLVALLALLLVAAVVGRNQIVAAFPAAVPVYQRLGLPVTLRLGLDFRGLASERRAEEGQAVPALVVNGEVVNVSGRERDVPRIRVGLLDGTGQEVSSELFDAPQRSLPPGGSTRFELRVASPPEAARDFSITFAETP